MALVSYVRVLSGSLIKINQYEEGFPPNPNWKLLVEVEATPGATRLAENTAIVIAATTVTRTYG